MRLDSTLGALAVLFVGASGWDREVVVAAAPVNMYSVLGVAVVLFCALFVAILVRYGFTR